MACCAGLLSLAAHAGPGMAVYLRSYYTEYEVTLDCTDQEHLSAADAATAKDAMAKIEAYYLKRDSSINKDKVMKQAVANKNQAFKMMQETTKVDARQFCRASLNDLISKVHEIDADAPGEKERLLTLPCATLSLPATSPFKPARLTPC